jgi:RimJ/RimL family protein N-acetyltransferase
VPGCLQNEDRRLLMIASCMMLKALETLETVRLVLRRPQEADLDDVFVRFASDPEVTRLMSWRRHESLADTHAFLSYSDAEWIRWPAGPYLVRSRTDGTLLGSTGLGFETPYRAMTGYVFAKDAWGRGYATEVLRAMVDLAGKLHVRRLYALCHVDHTASSRVLEKCGFTREGILRRHSEFPNLSPGVPCDVLCYSFLPAVIESEPQA